MSPHQPRYCRFYFMELFYSNESALEMKSLFPYQESNACIPHPTKFAEVEESKYSGSSLFIELQLT